MKIELIKELIAEFKNSDLTKLKLNDEGFELELEREKQTVAVQALNTVATQLPATHNPLTQGVNVETQSTPEKPVGHTINAPMVGTFYDSSSPESKPFVTVGSKVKKGDVVCIIEAMKLMNEVEADQDGEIVELLIENEAMVEFGQPLFRMK